MGCDGKDIRKPFWVFIIHTVLFASELTHDEFTKFCTVLRFTFLSLMI